MKTAEAIREELDAAPKVKGNGQVKPTSRCLTPAEWEAREIPPVDQIVGQLITSESRVLLSADTGKGKTQIGLALLFAAWIGNGFLHWRPGRKARGLFVDGEMPPGAIQRRLAIARTWFGLEVPPSDGLYVLSTRDQPDFKPLDTPEGQNWLDEYIRREIGTVDLLIFDNLQALTAMSLKEGESWLAMKAWVYGLSARRIGQFWLHHTGLDPSRAYGDKAREWGMDTVCVGEGNELNGAGVSLSLSFSKARNRDPDDPDSRAQFESTRLELRAGQWTSDAAISGGSRKATLGKKLPKNQKHVFGAATKLISGSDRRAPPHHPAKDRPVVTVEMVKEEAKRIIPCNANHFATRFEEALSGLTANGRLHHYDGLVWLP